MADANADADARPEGPDSPEGPRCPKCGSGEWIRDVNLDASGAIDIRFATLPNEQGRSRIRANFCGDCGYVELYAINPSELISAWKRQHEGDTPS